MLDERNTHGTNESQDIDDDLEDTGTDDEDTTPEEEDEGEGSEKGQKKETAEEVKERQKAAWRKKIESGEKTLDDMPENLGWLKKELEGDKKPNKEKKGNDDLDSKIDKVLLEREAKRDFNDLVDDLNEMDISAEQDAQLKEEYEDIISEFQNPTASQKLKAMTLACRVVGIKSHSENVRERRRKGRALLPSGGRRRTTITKDTSTEMEKKLGGNLPPGFKA